MGLPGVPAQAAELDDFIEAYESARAESGQADLADFLPPRDHPLYLAVLQELVRVELDHGWRHGRKPRLEQYQQRFPELFQDPDCLHAVAFEEYRLRRQLGDEPKAAEYKRRWGVNVEERPGGQAEVPTLQLAAWAGELEQADAPPPEDGFPAAGTQFLDFHLLAELGRGAFGRVYLVRQQGLAGRHVVLKIATNIGLETRLLAQLQHTNIIPVYSVHQAGSLQALCMPYLGSATLADVLRDLRGREQLPDSGKGLVDTAQACKSVTRQDMATQGVCQEPEALPDLAPVAWRQLERLTYVQAVVWLGARLADGLAHAHERGILHRDLKPANILLSDDGQPMLLDFNLSEDLKLRTGGAAAFIGGTLPYMAPEHLQAFRRAAVGVDARSDVYALGVILYELLTGRQPYPTRTGAVDGAVTQMIADRDGPPPRLRKWNRAVSPAVESIVRHCLEPNPGRRYQSARQLQEDLQCHLEHRPLRYAAEPSLRERGEKWLRRHPRLAVAGAGGVALLLLAAWVATLVVRSREKARWDAAALFEQFHEDAEQARILLSTSRATDRERLDEGAALARQALQRYQAERQPAWWEVPAVRNLNADARQQLRREVDELLAMLSSLPALGDARPRDPSPPDGFTPTGAALQRTVLGGRFRTDLPHWQGATRRDPRNVWAWAGLAVCYDNLARHGEAAASYGTCIALAPRLPWFYFKRGVAYLKAENFAEAKADFDHFLDVRPRTAEGYLNRALAWEGLRRYEPALQDITRAIDLGTPQTRAYFVRALLRQRTGDREGAGVDRAKGLKLEPADDVSYVVRGLAKLGSDPKAALADFDRALELNPRSLEALQNKASVLSEKLGRTEEAVRVLDQVVELAPTFVPARAGRGVLLARLGKRGAALRDAVAALRLDMRPSTVYQVAGIYALTSKVQPEDREEAYFLLSSALRKGYGSSLLAIDTDLDPIRNQPEFQRLKARAEGNAGTHEGP